MIEARDLHHSYGGGPVLSGAQLVADAGAVVGLIGPNGSGKTTLLRALSGSLTFDRGSVLLDGAALGSLTPREIARRIAVVVQETSGDLPLSVADTVLLGRLPHRGLFAGRSRTDEAIAAAALDRVGVGHLAARNLGELSGGERQRVLIARALTQQADHLLMDEPTNHLDVRYQHEVLALVRELGVTAVVVLHDLNLAARYCDRLLLLDRGRVRAMGETGDVLDLDTIPDVYGLQVDHVRAGDGVRQLLFRHPSTP